MKHLLSVIISTLTLHWRLSFQGDFAGTYDVDVASDSNQGIKHMRWRCHMMWAWERDQYNAGFESYTITGSPADDWVDAS